MLAPPGLLRSDRSAGSLEVFVTRSLGLCLVLAACSQHPDRVDPFDYPSGADETGLIPVPNDCKTRTDAFEAEATGYVEDKLKGIGTYEYRSVPDERTSIVLRSCGAQGPLPRLLAFNFFGATRVDKGKYDVGPDALTNGGFEFGYTDARNGNPTYCSDLPEGTITITKSTFSTIEGSFNVRARCFDQSVLDDVIRPPYTSFSGTFSASNEGNE